jgi:hypothetical protein
MNSNYFTENSQKENIRNKTKKSVSISTLVVSIITTIVLVFIVANKWSDILSFVGIEIDVKQQTDTNFFDIWDEVKLSWMILDDGDIINYTHTFSSIDFGDLWLKSSKINLNNYNDEVYLEWIVEKIHQWIPIVSVDTIYSLDIDEDLQEDSFTWEDSNSMYLSNLWIYLDETFFEKYSILNEWEWGIFKVKKIDTNEIISIDYFKCQKWNNEKDCDRFNQMFSSSSSQKFVDSDWTNYYKQSEVDSWFFSNDSLFGYFINNIQDSQVKELVKYINLVNTSFVEKNVLDNIDVLCWDGWNAIKEVTKTEIVTKNNKLFVLVDGNDGVKSTLYCELEVDPTLKNMAKLISLDVTWDLLEEEKLDEDLEEDQDEDLGEQDDSSELNYDWDVDVQQFPINLEKSLTFTSRRGHTFVFPSSNIAYAGQSIQKSFEQVWVSCFSVMNVVEYSQKDLVDQKWSVKIYECNIKDSFDDSDKKLIHKSFAKKDFVIEISDPAWVEFANNIEISVD